MPRSCTWGASYQGALLAIRLSRGSLATSVLFRPFHFADRSRPCSEGSRAPQNRNHKLGAEGIAAEDMEKELDWAPAFNQSQESQSEAEFKSWCCFNS